MLLVPRREGVVARGNSVLAPDFTVSPHSRKFTATLLLKHVLCGVYGLALGAVQAGRAARVVALVGPLAVRAAVYSAISILAHV